MAPDDHAVGHTRMILMQIKVEVDRIDEKIGHTVIAAADSDGFCRVLHACL